MLPNSPYWALVFDRRSRIVGVVVEEPNGRWRATVGARCVGEFASREGAEAFLIRLAEECDGTVIGAPERAPAQTANDDGA